MTGHEGMWLLILSRFEDDVLLRQGKLKPGLTNWHLWVEALWVYPDCREGRMRMGNRTGSRRRDKARENADDEAGHVARHSHDMGGCFFGLVSPGGSAWSPGEELVMGVLFVASGTTVVVLWKMVVDLLESGSKGEEKTRIEIVVKTDCRRDGIAFWSGVRN